MSVAEDLRVGHVGRAVVAVVLLAGLVLSPARASAQTPAGGPPGQGDDGEQPHPAGPPPSAVKATVERWLGVELAAVQVRYRRIETSAGVLGADQMQDNIAFRVRVKFDPDGRYALRAGMATGSSFIGGWNNTGVGTGGAATSLYLKQLYLSAAPVKGFEVHYGSLGLVRGESTEITTYDNDGYVVGERVTVKRPDRLYLDEITFTNGYLGDLTTPGFSDRYRRLTQANYRHLLAGKRFGTQLTASADYTWLQGISTIRAAVNLQTPGARVVDTVRWEQYGRLGEGGAFGFSAYAQKAVSPRVTVGAGYADIDPDYGGLNADRFGSGRRVFERVTVNVTRDLSTSVFLTQAVHNSFAVSTNRRFDVVLAFDVLSAIQGAGLFRCDGCQ